MATEYPGESEADLGFRLPESDTSVEGFQVPSTQMELPLNCPEVQRPHLNGTWWTALPIALVIGFSALGALISSFVLFSHTEHPHAIKRWTREVYKLPQPEDSATPATTSDFSLDQAPSFQIGTDFSFFDTSRSVSYTTFQSRSLVELWPPFSIATLYAEGTPLVDFSTSLDPVIAREPVNSENVNRMPSHRIAAEKIRKREFAQRLRHRIAKRVAEGAKSFSSFWAIWSRHLLGSGLAIPINSRRLTSRKLAGKKSKATLAFPLSWHRVGCPGCKRRANTHGVLSRSSRGQTGRFYRLGQYSRTQPTHR